MTYLLASCSFSIFTVGTITVGAILYIDNTTTDVDIAPFPSDKRIQNLKAAHNF